MAKALTIDTVRLHKDAELINHDSGKTTRIEKELILRELFEKFSKKPVDLTKVTLSKLESGNLEMSIGKTKYGVRKGEFEIIDISSKEKTDEEKTDEEKTTEEKTDEEKRAEAKAAKKAKKAEIKKLAKELKGEKEKKEEKEDGEDVEDGEDDEEEEKEDDADDDGEGEGPDMFGIAESLGEDIKKMPPKLGKLVEKGQKVKARLDKLAERFAKRFRRQFKKELRKHYGRKYRDENYEEVFNTLLEL